MKMTLLCLSLDGSLDGDRYLAEKHKSFYDGCTPPPHDDIPRVRDIPITRAAQLPTVPPILQQKIDAGIRCLERNINRRFRAAKGETIVSDTVSYLFRRYGAYDKDTIVVTRKTNLAELVVVFPGVKKEVLVDGATGAELLVIKEDGRSIYPVPPARPLDLVLVQVVPANALAAADSTYVLTSMKVDSSTKITFGWSITDDPGSTWWALYQGVMPSWTNLKEYVQWDYIAPKGSSNGKSGTQSVTVTKMVSGAIYTLALLKPKWDLMDSRQFNA